MSARRAMRQITPPEERETQQIKLIVAILDAPRSIGGNVTVQMSTLAAAVESLNEIPNVIVDVDSIETDSIVGDVPSPPSSDSNVGLYAGVAAAGAVLLFCTSFFIVLKYFKRKHRIQQEVDDLEKRKVAIAVSKKKLFEESSDDDDGD